MNSLQSGTLLNEPRFSVCLTQRLKLENVLTEKTGSKLNAAGRKRQHSCSAETNVPMKIWGIQKLIYIFQAVYLLVYWFKNHLAELKPFYLIDLIALTIIRSYTSAVYRSQSCVCSCFILKGIYYNFLLFIQFCLTS